MIKKILTFTLILLAVLIAAAFAAPFLFKDTIIAKIKTAANKNLNAKLDFSDVDISLFRHFPRMAVALNDIQVTGAGEFAADTLIAAKNIDLALNIVSVIRGDHMKVYGITLNSPRIHAIISKDGRANWDITKADSTTEDTTAGSKPFNLELQRYAIENGYISFTDHQSNTRAELVNIRHEGSGDFTDTHFILGTTTAADALNFSYGGIPYFANTRVNIDADVQVDNTTQTYTFETGNIRFNNLKLFTKGFFRMLTDSTYTMDIAFRAPSTAFKDVLSLVPTVYKKEFEKVKANGTALLNGFVKGNYGPGKIPAYNLNLDVKDGFFQYTDLPRPVKNINLAVHVNNPDGVTDHAVIDIPRAHLEMDDEPFDFRLLVKNPVTDMFVDGAAKGKLDLSRISQFVKLESGTRLTGTLMADVSAKGTITAIQKERYDQFNAAGTIAVAALQYAAKDYPDGIKINNLFMRFNPADVTISDLDGQYKKTNFSANGSIRNLVPYLMRNHTLSGQVHAKADNMNLNDWMGTSTDTTVKNTEASAPFAVPANLNLAVRAEVGRVVYDKLEIQQLTGNLTVNDERVNLNNIKGDALGGTMQINGTYDTKESKKKPDIRLAYDVKGLDMQKTFYAINTVQKLMPVGQYLSGTLSSQLSMTGKLGDNMMPDLSSLTGEGTILLIEGLLKKFAPLEKLADHLNINELKNIAMKDVRNHIAFTNGMVQVKPFTLSVKGVQMEIGGMHGFDQSLDYLINLKVPRVLMGSKGNALVNNLVTQVNNRGIPLTVGETVNLQVKMGGTVKNPQFRTDLKETAANMGEQLKQQAVDFARAKIDSSKKALKDTARALQQQAIKDIQEEARKKLLGIKDSALTNRNIIDSSKKRLEQAGKGLIRDLLKKKTGS